jgi:hypothetical protein
MKAQRSVEVEPYSFFNLGARWGGWSSPFGRFAHGLEIRYPFFRGMSGPQGRSGRVRIISLPPGFDPRIVQSLENRHTYYATPAHNNNNNNNSKPVSQKCREIRKCIFPKRISPLLTVQRMVSLVSPDQSL